MTLVVTDQILDADRERSLIERTQAEQVQDAWAEKRNLPVADVLVLNFMPKKDAAIVDLSLALGGAQDFNVRPHFLNVDISTIRDENGVSSCHINFPMEDYLDALDRHDFAGVIFNGASADEVPYERTSGLDDVKAAMDLARDRTGGVFNICWSAMTGLYVDHGVDKNVSDKKIIGVFDQVVTASGQKSALMKAWGNATPIPCGRLGYVPDANILSVDALDVLAATPQMADNYDLDSSIALVEDKAARTIYMLNHPEYGPDAIRKEYERDCANGGQGGLETPYPVGDFEVPKGQAAPWKQAAHNLFNAWLHALHTPEHSAKPEYPQPRANDNWPERSNEDQALDAALQMRS